LVKLATSATRMKTCTTSSGSGAGLFVMVGQSSQTALIYPLPDDK
jgi:hypothetical protein